MKELNEKKKQYNNNVVLKGVILFKWPDMKDYRPDGH